MSSVKEGPVFKVGGAPIVIRLAVRELVVIELVVRELIVAVSMITFEATNCILPLVVKNLPDVFVMLLVASRFCTYRVPVEMEPPVLSIMTFEALNDVILSAMNWEAIVRLVIPK